ncbi:MAG TPA: peptide ABC transporter substrate-binding protein [Candidatus Acidoferrales bacterium]|nr:peptide ABC transporter substrate-binding protein [Candidatus Acidoferrales bacterium]
MRQALKVLACAALLAALGGCTHRVEVAGQRHSWTRPHVLRAAIAFDPRSLSPLLATSVYELDLERLIFDALVTYDERGHPVPDLASRVPTLANGDVARDGRAVTFHLRRGVRWQDGAALTSADVAWTARAIVDPHNIATFRGGFDRIASIETPDPYTITFRFANPYPPAAVQIFGDDIWAYGVLPKHLLARYRSLDEAEFFTKKPIGSGPFAVASWRRGDRIELVANPAYFQGRPKLEKIVVSFVPNPQTELVLLREHAIDWYPTVPAQDVAAVKAIDGVRVLMKPQNRFVSVAFNAARAPLDDANVRRAIALGLDRASITSALMHGTAQEAVADIAPIVWAYPRGLLPLPYAPAEAARLLEKAGWTMGADGVRHKNGKRLELQLVYARALTYADLGAEIEQQLGRIGVAVDLRGYSRELLYTAQGVLQRGGFDMALQSWEGGLDPDDSFLFRCGQLPPAGQNYGRYCSAEMDRLQAAAMGVVQPEARRRAYRQIERLLLADVPQTFVWWPGDPHAVNSDFLHFRPNPVIDTWNAFEWDI